MSEEESILQVFEYAEPYYLGDYSNTDISKFIRKVLQERNNYKELYEKALKDLVKSDHIINELKKWLKEQDVFITELPAFTKEISIEHKTMSICYENILDKMQEIEKGNENDK